MTAELAGGEHDSSQNDEADMGMSYNDLDWYGKLRMMFKCGPLSMFIKLLNEPDPYWRAKTAREIGEKVKKFFKFYAMNRHKMSIITPAIHLVNYSPDDNRFDQRPIIVPINWYMFKHIDGYVAAMEAADAAASAAEHV
jgi:NAD+ synthase (glutamine-hydrolysing)